MAYTPIDKSDDYFNTVIWTGNDVSPRTITGVNFQPDFTWIKRRDGGDGNTNHNLYNSVIGAGNNTELSSNGVGAEGASLASSYGYLSAFASDGFTLTDGTDGSYEDLYTNQSGGTYVGWCWKAGGTAVSNTDGSITSSVSANTTSGFSIVSWTGTGANGTVGHGLGTTPAMIITKARSSYGSDAWYVVHQKSWNNDGDGLFLNNTAGVYDRVTDLLETGITTWGSSTFTINQGTATYLNNTSIPYIGYCFAEVKGFSKFGSYTGNGNADGTFVYTGFKPAMIIIKRTDAIKAWNITDSVRDTYNPQTKMLFPNASDAEYDGTSAQPVDKLSNGFKIRNTDANYNASGGTYIYMAFAESPFTTSTGIPTAAR